MRSGLGETWGRGEAVPERGTLQIRRRLDPEEGKNASEGGEPVRRSGKRSRARFLVVVDQSVRRGEATKMLFSSEREKRATRTQEENNTTTTTPTLRGATNTRAIPTVLLYTDTRREFIRVILRSLSLSLLFLRFSDLFFAAVYSLVAAAASFAVLPDSDRLLLRLCVVSWSVGVCASLFDRDNLSRRGPAPF